MRTRALQNNTVVWFGSYGLDKEKPVYDHDGSLIGYQAKKAENFANQQQGVRDSLVQRLSILKGELWYKVSFGIPLFDKVHSKTLIDTHVASVVTSHPDVQRIENFESTLLNHQYTCNMTIVTVYGNVQLQI